MIGVALEGGGARGAYHIGAVKALLENGYEIDGAVGTSIGAFNAALISQGDFEKAYDLWINMEPSKLFDIEDEHMKKLVHIDITKDTIRYITDKTKEIIENRGIDISRLRKVLEETICEEKLRNSSVDFGLVTVSLTDRKPVQIYKENIPEGLINDYIMASAYFPGFKMESIDGKYFIDGGIYDNCPVSLLIKKDYKEIFAIRTTRNNRSPKAIDKDINIINIVPSEDLGRILIFDNELVRKNIKMGYYDTLKVIKKLKGRRYYVEPLDEKIFLDIANNIPKDIILNIGEALNLPNMDSKRMLFERIIPEIAELLKLSLEASYQDIFIGLLEVIAEKKGINRFEIYTLEELFKSTWESNAIMNENNNKHRAFIRMKEFASQITRQNILDELACIILDTVSIGMLDIKE